MLPRIANNLLWKKSRASSSPFEGLYSSRAKDEWFNSKITFCSQVNPNICHSHKSSKEEGVQLHHHAYSFFFKGRKYGGEMGEGHVAQKS